MQTQMKAYASVCGGVDARQGRQAGRLALSLTAV
jgi:hypothetical protein